MDHDVGVVGRDVVEEEDKRSEDTGFNVVFDDVEMEVVLVMEEGMSSE